MSRYGFEESIRDGATLPLHFEPRLRRAARRPARRSMRRYQELTGGLTDEDQDPSPSGAAKLAVLRQGRPSACERICEDIATHYQREGRAQRLQGAGRRLSTGSACLLYKAALDELLGAEASDSGHLGEQGSDESWRRPTKWRIREDEEERLLDRFRDPNDPLKILIVTAKLLTGFDAPDPAGDVPGQAAARPHAAAGHLPHQPHLRREEDARPDRGLPGRVRRRREGAGVRREGLPAAWCPTSTSSRTQLPAAHGEVPRVLPRRGPRRRRLRGADGRAGLPARPTTRATHFAADYSVLAKLWEALSPDPVLAPVRAGLPLADAGLRVGPAAQRAGQAPLARARRQDHRADPRERPRRCGARRSRHAGAWTPMCWRPCSTTPTREEGQGGRAQNRAAAAQAHGRPEVHGARRAAGGAPAAPRAGARHSVEYLKALLEIAKDVVAVEREVPPDEDRTAARRR